jgi:heme exporter protein B
MIIPIIKQEIAQQIKSLSNVVQSLVFLFITTSIFAISVNIQDSQTSIGAIWICLIFAIILAGNNCFQRDFDDGTFQQLFLSGYIFEIIIFSKIIASWLVNCLPLIIILPIIALILKIDENLIPNLLIIAVIATLLINFIVAFGSSLTLSASATNCLLTILILPLLIPVIIFANSSLNNPEISIKFLLSLLIFLSPILTFATAAAVKINVVE